MRIARTIVFAIAAIALLGVSAASAQTPFVAAYFDEFGTVESLSSCGTGTGNIWFYGQNWNMLVTGYQFKADYPVGMTFIADDIKQPVTIGNTADGISTGYAVPQNGFSPVFIVRSVFAWNCSDCDTPNQEVVVVPHPISGKILATRFGDAAEFSGTGLTATICPTVANEETTWGQVKQLFE
jgi:hypothetical protein